MNARFTSLLLWTAPVSTRALALLWDRYELGSRRWLRGRTLTWGRLRVHTTSLVSGLLFVVVAGLVAWRRWRKPVDPTDSETESRPTVGSGSGARES